MTSVIHQKYAHLKPQLLDIVQHFDQSGTVLYSGRNTLKSFEVEGRCVVVKRFKPLHLLKGVIYTFFRDTKARRSYENALKLDSRGVSSPYPLAFVEVRKNGLIHDTYYFCEYTDYQEIASELNASDDFNTSLAEAFGCFVADLHVRGILHYDLNSGNVLFRQTSDGRYLFQLIDINRMKFMPQGQEVPLDECLENLTLFTGNLTLHAHVAASYAGQRGYDITEFVAMAHRRKKAHDRRWRWRKALSHPLRTLSKICSSHADH